MVVFLVYRKKIINFITFGHPWKILWLAVKKSANTPQPWKKFLSMPTPQSKGKSFADITRVSKVSGTKDDDMFFNGFISVISASTSMSSCTSR